MPSPATHLRAPLLWLLLPLMAGLTAAKLWPAPAFGLWPLALAAGGLSLTASGFAFRSARYAGPAWGVCLSLAGGLAGFVFLQMREPHLHQREDRPLREVTVTIEVLQIFPASVQARSQSGLGRIVASNGPDRELTGRRVYFSAIRKISVPPQRAGRYLVRGVIESLSPSPADAGLNAAHSPAVLPGASPGSAVQQSTRGLPSTAGTGLAGRRPNPTLETPQPAAGNISEFNDYLDNLGIRQKLTRAQILREEQPPGRLPRFFSRLRSRLEVFLGRGLDRHPQIVSLYRAMLLGEKAALSTEQQNAFMRSGTFHIFCIAGLHVGVIAIALQSVLRLLRVPRRPEAGLTLLLLWLYVQITGANIPAERAFLMITFWLVSRAFHWPGNGLAALAAAALVTLLLDPLQLFSTGFQMSYTVVTTLVVMGVPLAEKWLGAWRPFSYRPKPDWRWYHHAISWSGRRLLGGAAACWATFVACTPSSIGYFHLFSPGSLVANLAIIPLASLAITGGFLSLLCGLAGLLSLGALFNSAAALIIIIMDWFVRHDAAVPGFYFPAHFTSGWMAPVSLVAMTGVMFASLSGRWSPRYGGFWPPVLLIVLILILGVKFG